MRECLKEAYDVPALVNLMTGIANRRVRVLEAETAKPSPFAASLLFGYVDAFMYEGRFAAGRAARRGPVAGQLAVGRAAWT
ncbi:hypothetical protein [Mycobacterium tilburgii]|uniref:hypothetical protein n=1 Tax=Mycobacterium tilburgii TaxID=44467 RepID=UPI0021B38FBE|nr:hypothetical protein [Mycobacterium tilburgii]